MPLPSTFQLLYKDSLLTNPSVTVAVLGVFYDVPPATASQKSFGNHLGSNSGKLLVNFHIHGAHIVLTFIYHKNQAFT